MKATLSLTTLGGEKVKYQSLVECLEISELYGNNAVPNLFSRSERPVTVHLIPRKNNVDRWPYPKGIHVPRTDA